MGCSEHSKDINMTRRLIGSPGACLCFTGTQCMSDSGSCVAYTYAQAEADSVNAGNRCLDDTQQVCTEVDCSTVTVLQDEFVQPYTQFYSIGASELTISVDGLFTSDSAYSSCWVYSLEVVTPLPSDDLNAISFDTTTNTIGVQTTLEASAGDYMVSIKAIDQGLNQEIESYSFMIRLGSQAVDCSNYSVAADSEPQPFTYGIGSDDIYDLNPLFTTTPSEADICWELELIFTQTHANYALAKESVTLSQDGKLTVQTDYDQTDVQFVMGVRAVGLQARVLKYETQEFSVNCMPMQSYICSTDTLELDKEDTFEGIAYTGYSGFAHEIFFDPSLLTNARAGIEGVWEDTGNGESTTLNYDGTAEPGTTWQYLAADSSKVLVNSIVYNLSTDRLTAISEDETSTKTFQSQLDATEITQECGELTWQLFASDPSTAAVAGIEFLDNTISIPTDTGPNQLSIRIVAFYANYPDVMVEKVFDILLEDPYQVVCTADSLTIDPNNDTFTPMPENSYVLLTGTPAQISLDDLLVSTSIAGEYDFTYNSSTVQLLTLNLDGTTASDLPDFDGGSWTVTSTDKVEITTTTPESLLFFISDDRRTLSKIAQDGTLSSEAVATLHSTELRVSDTSTCGGLEYSLISATYELVEWIVVDGQIYVDDGSNAQIIYNWSTTHTLDEIKNICKTNGYSAFVVGKDGTQYADNIYFKTYNYQLTLDMLDTWDGIDQFYIANRSEMPASGIQLNQPSTLMVDADIPINDYTVLLEVHYANYVNVKAEIEFKVSVLDGNNLACAGDLLTFNPDVEVFLLDTPSLTVTKPIQLADEHKKLTWDINLVLSSSGFEMDWCGGIMFIITPVAPTTLYELTGDAASTWLEVIPDGDLKFSIEPTIAASDASEEMTYTITAQHQEVFSALDKSAPDFAATFISGNEEKTFTIKYEDPWVYDGDSEFVACDVTTIPRTIDFCEPAFANGFECEENSVDDYAWDEHVICLTTSRNKYSAGTSNDDELFYVSWLDRTEFQPQAHESWASLSEYTVLYEHAEIDAYARIGNESQVRFSSTETLNYGTNRSIQRENSGGMVFYLKTEENGGAPLTRAADFIGNWFSTYAKIPADFAHNLYSAGYGRTVSFEYNYYEKMAEACLEATSRVTAQWEFSIDDVCPTCENDVIDIENRLDHLNYIGHYWNRGFPTSIDWNSDIVENESSLYFDHCGGITWTFPDLNDQIFTVEFDIAEYGTDSVKLDVIADLTEQQGPYTFTVRASYTNYPSVFVENQYTIEVKNEQQILDLSGLDTTYSICPDNPAEIDLCQIATALNFTCPATETEELCVTASTSPSLWLDEDEDQGAKKLLFSARLSLAGNTFNLYEFSHVSQRASTDYVFGPNNYFTTTETSADAVIQIAEDRADYSVGNFHLTFGTMAVSESLSCNEFLQAKQLDYGVNTYEPYSQFLVTIDQECTEYPDEEKYPQALDPVDPIVGDLMSGDTFGPETIDEWHVPYKHYQMTKLRVWKSEIEISGFEVTFEVKCTHDNYCNDFQYTGWEPITHMFGTASLNTEYEELNAHEEYHYKGNEWRHMYCKTGQFSSHDSSIVYLQFWKEHNQDITAQISREFTEIESIETSDGKLNSILVGFKTISSENKVGQFKTIRSIAAITDSSSYSAAVFTNGFPGSVVYQIGTEEVMLLTKSFKFESAFGRSDFELYMNSSPPGAGEWLTIEKHGNNRDAVITLTLTEAPAGVYPFSFSYKGVPDYESVEPPQQIYTHQIIVRLEPGPIPTTYKQCSGTGTLVTMPELNICSILMSFSTTDSPVTCPVSDDEQSICYALSNSPESLSDDDAKLFRLTQSSLPRAFVNNAWSSTTDEFPEEGSEVIDYDYGPHQTRWLWFTTSRAEDCSMALFQNIEPKFVFTVEEDCATRTDTNSYGETKLSTKQGLTWGGINAASSFNTTQYCEQRNNKLTQMKVWKDQSKISGFEAVFEVDDDSGSYPQTVLLFGTKSLVTGYEEAAFTEEVVGIGFRFHDQGIGNNLASIQLQGETELTEFNAYDFDIPATGWYDLNTRIIGFDVLEGQPEDQSIYDIRAIRPLEDFSSCQLSLSSSSSGSNSLEMIQLIDVESDDDQIVTLDLSTSASTPFGEQCDDFELEEWIVVDGHDYGGISFTPSGSHSNKQIIRNWSTTHTLDEIKNICKTNGYSGFLIGKDGTSYANSIFFKKFYKQLTPDMLVPTYCCSNQFYISQQNLDSITLSGTELTLTSNKDTPASIQTVTLALKQTYDYGGEAQTLEQMVFELSVNIYRKSDYPRSFSYCDGTSDLNVVDLAASLGYVRPLTAEDPQICFYIGESDFMRKIGPTNIKRKHSGMSSWETDNQFSSPAGWYKGNIDGSFGTRFKYVSDSSECNNSFKSSHEPIYTTEYDDHCVDPQTPKAPFSILTPTNPQHQPMLNGQEVATVDEVTWHVPYKFYSLSKLLIWPTPSGIQGFEVTFSVPDDFTGHEQQRQMFGSSISVKDYQSITITDEITSLKLRSDGKSLREIQLMTGDDELVVSVGQISDDEEQEIAWEEVTVSGRKLIGFHTKTTIDEDVKLWMIKSIAPILDESNCEDSTPNWDPETSEALTMIQHKNSGQTDSNNSLKLVDRYGYESCSFELSIAPEKPFIWFENRSIKLKSTAETSEQLHSFTITLTPTHSEAEYEPGPWMFPLTVEILPEIITVSEEQQKVVAELVSSLEASPLLIPEPASRYFTEAKAAFDLYIGEPTSFTDNDAVVTVDLGSNSFIRYDQSSQMISIQYGVTTVESIGQYRVEIKIQDEEDEELFTEYSILIMVTESTIPYVEECAEDQELVCEVTDSEIETCTCQAVSPCSEQEELVCTIYQGEEVETCECIELLQCEDENILCHLDESDIERCECVEETSNDLDCAEDEIICQLETNDQGEETEVCECPPPQCTDEEKVCRTETIDGEDFEVCECPEEDLEECTEEEKVCETEVGPDDMEVEICSCPAQECADDDLVCTTEIDENEVEVTTCTCESPSSAAQPDQSSETQQPRANEQAQNTEATPTGGRPMNAYAPSSPTPEEAPFRPIPPVSTGLMSVFNVQEPAPKIKNVRNDGKMGIAFNNRMVLPDDFLEIVSASKRRDLTDDLPLIEILSEPGSESNPDLMNLDWEINGFTDSSLDFKLIYKNPLEISQGNEPDIVTIVLNLGRFTDEYGQPMANGITMSVEVPRQIPSEQEAKALDTTGETAENASFAVMGGNFLINLILVASLNHLWTMINGLQLATHLQLFALKFPANASFLVRFLTNIANFDILPIEVIWYFLEYPQRGAYSLSFSSSGYEYLHSVENLGISFLLIQVYCILCFICLVLFCFKGKSEFAMKYYHKLKEKLFWGAAIRFIFESYLEMTICVCIGILTMEWLENNFASYLGNLLTIALTVAVCIMPLFTSVFYALNMDNMEDQEFNTKFGTLYSGLNLSMEDKKKKYSLIFPFFFVLRRILFVISAIVFSNFLWMQLAIQFLTCTASVIYLLHHWPFDERKFTILEVINEITAIFLMYCCFTFTDWVPLAEIRYMCGWVFILIISANLSLHVYGLCKNKVMACRDTYTGYTRKKRREKQEEDDIASGKTRVWKHYKPKPEPRLKTIQELEAENDSNSDFSREILVQVPWEDSYRNPINAERFAVQIAAEQAGADFFCTRQKRVKEELTNRHVMEEIKEARESPSSRYTIEQLELAHEQGLILPESGDDSLSSYHMSDYWSQSYDLDDPEWNSKKPYSSYTAQQERKREARRNALAFHERKPQRSQFRQVSKHQTPEDAIDAMNRRLAKKVAEEGNSETKQVTQQAATASFQAAMPFYIPKQQLASLNMAPNAGFRNQIASKKKPAQKPALMDLNDITLESAVAPSRSQPKEESVKPMLKVDPKPTAITRMNDPTWTAARSLSIAKHTLMRMNKK